MEVLFVVAAIWWIFSVERRVRRLRNLLVEVEEAADRKVGFVDARVKDLNQSTLQLRKDTEEMIQDAARALHNNLYRDLKGG